MEKSHFMKNLDIPVLFIPFARPEYARKTFDAIKAAKPRRLYVYLDKGREGFPEEIRRNSEIRDFMINEINWECDLFTNFNEENFGPYKAIICAIDWIFEHEQYAIILEEDVVPTNAFFDFCSKLLPMYKNESRVWFISGTNNLEEFNPNGYDFLFTRTANMWGFATWKDRWDKIVRHDFPFEEMKKYGVHLQYAVPKKKVNFLMRSDEKAFNFIRSNGQYPCWDLIFNLNLTKEGAFGIIPARNLVSNIGVVGHHANGASVFYHNKNVRNSNSYIITNPPPFVLPDFKYENYFIDLLYKRKKFSYVFISKIKRLVSKTKGILIDYFKF
jgi:hypothetical protein